METFCFCFCFKDLFIFVGFLGFKDNTYRTDDEEDEEEDKEGDKEKDK